MIRRIQEVPNDFAFGDINSFLDEASELAHDIGFPSGPIERFENRPKQPDKIVALNGFNLCEPVGTDGSPVILHIIHRQPDGSLVDMVSARSKADHRQLAITHLNRWIRAIDGTIISPASQPPPPQVEPWQPPPINWNASSGKTIDGKDRADSQPKSTNSQTPDPSDFGRGESDGEWSLPMTKTEMMVRLKLNPKTFNTFAARHGLKKIGRQQWQIRLDGMDAATRRRIEIGK